MRNVFVATSSHRWQPYTDRWQGIRAVYALPTGAVFGAYIAAGAPFYQLHPGKLLEDIM